MMAERQTLDTEHEIAPSARKHPTALTPRLLERGKATVYKVGGFGVHRSEVSRIKVWTDKYAQFTDAVFCQTVDRGKRKPRTIVDSYRPSLLVLDGWGHPDPGSAMTVGTPSGTGFMVSQTRHTCFSEEWIVEFESLITPYLAANPHVVLADYRGFSTGG